MIMIHDELQAHWETQHMMPFHSRGNWAPSQYPKRRLSVRSRKVSMPRDLYLESSDHSEIWLALRQQCCRCVCQISKRYDNLKYQSRGFETLRDLTKRRLFGYWDGAQITNFTRHHEAINLVQLTSKVCSLKGHYNLFHTNTSVGNIAIKCSFQIGSN